MHIKEVAESSDGVVCRDEFVAVEHHRFYTFLPLDSQRLVGADEIVVMVEGDCALHVVNDDIVEGGMLHIGTFVVEAIIISPARLYARGMLEDDLETLTVQLRPVGLIECGSLE